MMRAVTILGFVAGGLLWAVPAAAGISGYLPLNLEPRLEHDVERLMVLAGEPVIRRPIALAAIERAMPAACVADEALCMQVQRELAPWLGRAALGMASFEAAIASAAQVPQPNERGTPMDAKWQAAAQGYVRVGEHAAVNVGGVAYRGRVNPAGTFVSVGFSRAQLDIGFRDHHWSPMRDSAFLLSTEAPTILSATLSNSVPLTRFKLQYEAFGGRLSSSDRIYAVDRYVTGKPGYAGVHVSFQPVSGWQLSGSRVIEFGGGRPFTWGSLVRAFAGGVSADSSGSSTEFGNSQISVSSAFIIPGPRPMAVYAEFAAEDTFHSQVYRFNSSALSVGVFLPRFRPDIQLRYEFSDWEDRWYTHHLYADGINNYRFVTGHWGADWRRFNDTAGAQSHMLQLDLQRPTGAAYSFRYRTLQNASYTSGNYRRAHMLSVQGSAPWRGIELAAGLELGRDTYAKAFGRLSLTAYLSGDAKNVALSVPEAATGSHENPAVERFVDVGAYVGRMRYEQDVRTIPGRFSNERSPQFGLGIRRAISRRNDLGTRVEVNNLHGHNIYGLRVLDYRFRASGRIAFTGFAGAARYELQSPAHGFYLGAGVQLRNVRPGWDVAVESRYYDRIVRMKTTAGEPTFIWPNEFYSVLGASLTLSRRF